jgi:hypothetical protein
MSDINDMKKLFDLTKVKVDDIVLRTLGADGPEMRLRVTKIDDYIHCGDWKFSKQNGAEIDEDLGWNERYTGSYIRLPL